MMTATQEMERRILEEIEEMVYELGDDSYLAAAFEGAFEIAVKNIQNDVRCTTQEYIDAANNAEEKARQESEELKEQIARLKHELETQNANLRILQSNNEQYEKELAELRRHEEK
ncbi:MAG: hypothetical protein RO469_15665 [Thermincola sp.]|jgi:septal ring factor EnvC (AmiA/AmiB activator)|nr:hypothetical protein [Thermincola sp.]MDT3702668.1 hypothetical protein [Thermincola sp.]